MRARSNSDSRLRRSASVGGTPRHVFVAPGVRSFPSTASVSGGRAERSAESVRILDSRSSGGGPSGLGSQASVSSVGGVPADLQKAGTGGNVDRDYGGVVRTPENWMI